MDIVAESYDYENCDSKTAIRRIEGSEIRSHEQRRNFNLKERQSSRGIDFKAEEAGDTQTVKISLFGHECDVLGYGNSREVQKLADFITQRAESIKKKTAAKSTLDLAILTLLNITEEMLQHKHVKEVTIKKLEEKTDRLLKAIDKIV